MPSTATYIRSADTVVLPFRNTPEPALVRDIRRHVAEHLGDPELSPASVARAVGVSVRHLHRLLAGAGAGSLGEWVRRSRLERCAADLRDPALAHENLTQIAFRWGFNDSAHFSRSFRAAYHQAPRDYRAGRQARAGSSRRRPAAFDQRELQTCL